MKNNNYMGGVIVAFTIALDRFKENHYLFNNRMLLALFAPLIIEQFLSYMVGLADSTMIAYLGESAVAGVSLVDFIMQLIGSVFVATTTGGMIIASQYLGNNKISKANTTANQLVWFSAILALFVMVLLYIGKDVVITFLFGQITPDVRGHADMYMQVLLASIPFVAVYNAGAAIFRTMNNSKRPMQIMLAMNVLNIIGNAISIYILDLGTAGIALSTLLTRMLAAVIIIYPLLADKYLLNIKCTLKYKVNMSLIRSILTIGVPLGLENILFYLGRIVVLSMIAKLGTVAIAANSIAGVLSIFSVMIGMSVNIGMTVVISKCVGIGDYEQVKYYHKKIMVIVYVLHILINLAIAALLPVVLNIYAVSSDVQQLTHTLVLWHCAWAIIIWPLAYTIPTSLRAAGDVRYPMVIGILSMFLCRIILAYILIQYFDMGLLGTYIAMFMDWLIKAVFFIYRYNSGAWMRFKLV